MQKGKESKFCLIPQSVLTQEIQQLRRDKKRRKRGGVLNKEYLMNMITFFNVFSLETQPTQLFPQNINQFHENTLFKHCLS